MLSVIPLPGVIERALNLTLSDLLAGPSESRIDFSQPAGEPSLVAADSVSWRIFKNPVTLFVGGVAAVIWELAEPSVCAGIWDHSSFRTDPASRLRRTGLATMVSVYGARSIATGMIANVRRMHAAVSGTTRAGIAYSASDPRLLGWVHATAAFSFGSAYSVYVHTLDEPSIDALYQEGQQVAHLYGVKNPPMSSREMQHCLADMQSQLQPSLVLFEFLDMMRERALLPSPLRWLQPVLVRAAVDLLPEILRERLELSSFGLRAAEKWLVRAMAGVADRIVMSDSPAAQSCRRLGLPLRYLYV